MAEPPHKADRDDASANTGETIKGQPAGSLPIPEEALRALERGAAGGGGADGDSDAESDDRQAAASADEPVARTGPAPRAIRTGDTGNVVDDEDLADYASSDTLPAADTHDVSSSDRLAAASGTSRPQDELALRQAREVAGSQPLAPEQGRDMSLGKRSGETDTWLGRTLAGRYTLLERIGRGGMSVVYLAEHELLKKAVAVKVLRDDMAINKNSLTRFHREAMAAAGIGDPHIVDITDYGFTDDGNAFIVMERLVGSDLRTALRREGAFAAGRAVAITRQILRALEAAHARGIVHRDLKAENVFLTQRDGAEFVKLLDFGISKILERPDTETEHDGVVTSTGIVMGTPQYIAPEQAHGDRDLDHRVDIYSLGVILYEMLVGELPFKGRSALELVMKHVQDKPEPPRERRPDLDIPADLEAVALKAMSKERDKRYDSARDMLQSLPASRALPGGYSSAALPAADGRPTRWPYWLIFFGLMGALALLLFVVFPPKRSKRAAGIQGPATAGDSSTKRGRATAIVKARKGRSGSAEDGKDGKDVDGSNAATSGGDGAAASRGDAATTVVGLGSGRGSGSGADTASADGGASNTTANAAAGSGSGSGSAVANAGSGSGSGSGSATASASAGSGSGSAVAKAGVAAASSRVTLVLRVVPRTARLRVAGKLVGRGRMQRTVERGSAPVDVSISATGYVGRTMRLTTQANVSRTVRLRRRATRGSGKGTGSTDGKTPPADLHPNPYGKNKKKKK